MTRDTRRLPDAELAVMQALWACEAPAGRSDLEGILQGTHPMAATTLLTLLSRLADKGFVRSEKVGRSARYTPWSLRRTIWPGRAAGFWTSCAAAACPPLPTPCAAAGSPARSWMSCATC